MNRLVPLVLAFAISIPFVPAAAQELPPGGTFIDDDGSVHEPAIEALVAAGITQGCETDRYCPDDPVTRGQMASFIARALPDLDPATRDWFTDDDGNVHEPDIDIIAENGITLGYTDGTFRPEATVTRAEMASFIARALPDLDPATRDWFTDDDGNVHEPNIDIIAENGITLGYTDGTFRPDTPISRAEMASMLVRALDLTPIVPPPRTRTIAIYLYLESLGDEPSGPGPFLVPVARNVHWSPTPASDAMGQLLAGPTPAESASIPALSTALAADTVTSSIAITEGVATVGLIGAGTATVRNIAQVVFTLTQFPTVDRVEVVIDSLAVEEVDGIDAPFTRESFLDAGILPMIFVDQPLFGAATANPMRLVGHTFAFEAQFQVVIVDVDGLIIAEVPVLANGPQVISPGGIPWTSFDVTIPYPVEIAQRGAVIAFDTSAKDGSQIGVREYPVTLSPS